MDAQMLVNQSKYAYISSKQILGALEKAGQELCPIGTDSERENAGY